jgi:hypothetical protein
MQFSYNIQTHNSFWINVSFMSSITVSGSQPVARKPVWLTIVVQHMTAVDSNHAVCHSCCYTQLFIATRSSAPHEVADMSQINSLHLSLSPPFIDPHSSAEQLKGPLLVMEGRSDYGGVVYQWGKAINMPQLQNHIPPLVV